MKLSSFWTLAGLVTAFAAPFEKRTGYAVKERHHVPSQWKQVGKPLPGHTIRLQIGLKQSSFDELERHLFEVSDPDHARYGQHLSHEDIHELVAPSEQSLSSVHEWLEEYHVRLDQVEYSPSKDWLMVSLPVSEIEELLDTEYHVYEDEQGSQLVRTPEYSLPLSLHRHIDVIQPTNYFSQPRAMGSTFRFAGEYHASQQTIDDQKSLDTANASAVCNTSAVTPLCLRTLYNTINYTPKVPQQNFVAITAYLNETANYSDFHIFMSQQRKDAAPSYQYNYTLINGAIDHQAPETIYYGVRDLEANLDVQTVGGLAYPTKFTVYSTGGSPPYVPDISTQSDTNEPYLNWVQYMQTLKVVPKTISSSYGDNEQTVPLSYATRVCQEFAQLGAKGATLLFSSGDNGVGTNGTCISNNRKNTPAFLPAFPASCPYVTTVGGTRNVAPEIVAYDVENGYVSGSGVSNYFGRPAYQQAAVSQYLKSIGNLHKGLYNTTGRAYPDIAAQSYHFVVTYGGQNILLDGTSAASPTAAGVLTNVNDALLAAGKPPLGFLNPWLYKRGFTGFNDITIGNSWGCDTSGFPAEKGWDLASGFGTPDFKKITAGIAPSPPPYSPPGYGQ